MDVVAGTNNSRTQPKVKSFRRIRKDIEAMIADAQWSARKPLFLYDMPGGGQVYSRLRPRDYFATIKEVEDFLANPPVNEDPTYQKQQSDELCLYYFPKIQSVCEELADYVLVEPMALRTITIVGLWAHMNFKAKHKDADDASSAIYFAELNPIENKVTCLVKLDIDLSADTSAYEHCRFCHPAPGGEDIPVSGFGCVYHPVDAKLFLQ